MKIEFLCFSGLIDGCSGGQVEDKHKFKIMLMNDKKWVNIYIVITKLCGLE